MWPHVVCCYTKGLRTWDALLRNMRSLSLSIGSCWPKSCGLWSVTGSCRKMADWSDKSGDSEHVSDSSTSSETSGSSSFSSETSNVYSKRAKRRKKRKHVTLVPEVFLDFSPYERAAKRRTRVTKRRERKTFAYLGLESHFHAEARVRIWPSASDWLIFLKTRKSIWLVSFMGNTEGTVGISVTALLVVGNRFGWFQWGFLSTFPGGKHSRKHAFK